MSGRDLRVELVDDHIIITLPGTSYRVTYYKRSGFPRPIARQHPSRDDPNAPMTKAEFLARAWTLANDKTRELGWKWGGS
jgi:hypothetical protein